ncbi:MAG: ATP synthase F1 subunit delta [Alphaproteobacteria bacterium]|nr:ATP synthase F1 subunit delta [Alphaproteobacteria bacterium]
MSAVETKRDEIAKRYGGVLFTLSQESQSLKAILKEATLLHQYLQEASFLWARLVSPVASLHIQQKVVESLTSSLKLGSLMRRFLMILCQNHRLQNLMSILDDFILRAQGAEGVIGGVLETAMTLSKKEIEDLQNSLTVQLGKEVSLRQDVKESLIAGVILHIGSQMIDASLGTQLSKLRQAMKG